MEFLERPNFMEICPVGNTLIHADRWTDVTKLTGVFHDYTNMPKMYVRIQKGMSAQQSIFITI